MHRVIDTSSKTARLGRGEKSGPASIRDGHADNVGSVRRRENIHNRAVYRGDRHSLMPVDLLRREVGPIDHDPFGVLPP